MMSGVAVGGLAPSFDGWAGGPGRVRATRWRLRARLLLFVVGLAAFLDLPDLEGDFTPSRTSETATWLGSDSTRLLAAVAVSAL